MVNNRYYLSISEINIKEGVLNMEKVIDIEDRIPTLKKRRKKRTNRKFIVLILLFFLVLSVLLYFQSPYSDIKTIEVKGAHLVEDHYYIEASKVVKGQSMWGFKVNDVEQAIMQDAWVEDVTVKRKWLQKVMIEVKELKKVAYLAENGSYYPLLENGKRFEQADDNIPIDAPVFMGITDEKKIHKLVKQLALLKPEVLALISQINSNESETNPNAIRLFMNDGYEVRAVISTLAEKLNYYPAMVAQILDLEKGIFDLEVGSSFKPYNIAYNQVELDMTEDVVKTEQEVAEDEQQEE